MTRLAPALAAATLLAGSVLSSSGAARPPAASPGAALDPAAMIALADADPRRSHQGLFTMKVASASKEGGPITYLNSQPDYKMAGDVTFGLSPFAAKALAARLGGAVSERAVGKTITVRGVLTRRPIVDTDGGRNGRARSFNRWGYQVAVTSAGQIVNVEG